MRKSKPKNSARNKDDNQPRRSGRQILRLRLANKDVRISILLFIILLILFDRYNNCMYMKCIWNNCRTFSYEFGTIKDYI